MLGQKVIASTHLNDYFQSFILGKMKVRLSELPLHCRYGVSQVKDRHFPASGNKPEKGRKSISCSYHVFQFKQENGAPKNCGKLSVAWPCGFVHEVSHQVSPFLWCLGPRVAVTSKVCQTEKISMWCHKVYLRTTGSKGFHTATIPCDLTIFCLSTRSLWLPSWKEKGSWTEQSVLGISQCVPFPLWAVYSYIG